MLPFRLRQATPGLLLGAALLGVLLYLYGLATTLHFGDANAPGVLLIPTLPTPLYFVMGVVMLAGVGVTLLAALRQRRRRAELQEQRQETPVRTAWQAMASTLGSLALLLIGVLWLLRHSDEVTSLLERLRAEVHLAQELLDSGTQSLVEQVQSSTTGYAIFTVVILVYGGLGLLGVWMLCESWGRGRLPALADETSSPHVQRAIAAGLQALRTHTDPRQAIIACYARLEHLLTDYGVPAHAHLTPQEYMGEALRTLELPTEAFAGLVALFELARYSLHPLDETARATALAHLEHVQAHLQQDHTHATAV